MARLEIVKPDDLRAIARDTSAAACEFSRRYSALVSAQCAGFGEFADPNVIDRLSAGAIKLADAATELRAFSERLNKEPIA